MLSNNSKVFFNSQHAQKIIAYWLLFGAMLVVMQVLLGGITRITESGLSITEWKPIGGSLPPFSQEAWQQLFEKYKQTDQFLYLKNDITLSEFKSIFFWEWVHRNWARFMSAVFIVPFIIFIKYKWLTKKQVVQLLCLLGLGAFQGLMGWLMVKSGLKKGNLFVEHTFLSIHFILALITLAMCIYFALEILYDKTKIYFNNKLDLFNKIFFGVVVVQLIYGAFMSGMHAASVATTWPSINGSFIPDNIMAQQPMMSNLLNNKFTVQFIHRMLAYCIFIITILWTIKIYYKQVSVMLKLSLICIVFTQIILGISSLLAVSNRGAFRFLAVSHQFVGMLLFSNFIFLLFFIQKKSPALNK